MTPDAVAAAGPHIATALVVREQNQFTLVHTDQFVFDSLHDIPKPFRVDNKAD